MARNGTETVNHSSWNVDAGDRLVLGCIALFCLITAICPIVRAFYHFEVNYKEGWMMYNTLAVVHHVPLYGTKYGWTTVDYPALSFYIMAYLSRWSRDYLLTGRLVSLVSFGICALLVGAIVRKLTGRLAPALFASAFCVGLFCSAATRYIGLDDPQMLAEVFFLSGLLLYLSNGPSWGRIGLIVFLFVLGGNIKHNLLDLPLALFIDLCLTSRRKAVQFLLFAAVLVSGSILVSMKAAGPFFIQNMLSVRPYSPVGAIADFLYYYGTIFLPFIAALMWAIKERRDEPNRLIAIFFFTSLFTGIFFSGGSGISINVYFGNFFAISIIMGMLLYSAWKSPSTIRYKFLGRWGLPIAMSASLLVAFTFSGYVNIWKRIKMMPDEQKQYDAEVSFIRKQPGSAICESLLRCFDAGKPYVYDPYSSTRLVYLKKLDSGDIVDKIETFDYGAIQLHGPLQSLERPNERFPNDVLDAIGHYYNLSAQDQECAIYVPNSGRKNAANVEARLRPLSGNRRSP